MKTLLEQTPQTKAGKKLKLYLLRDAVNNPNTDPADAEMYRLEMQYLEEQIGRATGARQPTVTVPIKQVKPLPRRMEWIHN